MSTFLADLARRIIPDPPCKWTIVNKEDLADLVRMMEDDRITFVKVDWCEHAVKYLNHTFVAAKNVYRGTVTFSDRLPKDVVAASSASAEPEVMYANVQHHPIAFRYTDENYRWTIEYATKGMFVDRVWHKLERIRGLSSDLVVAKSLDEAIDIAKEFARQHLQYATKRKCHYCSSPVPYKGIIFPDRSSS